MKKYLPKFHFTTILYLGICFYFQWYKESLTLFAIILFHEYCHLMIASFLKYDIDGLVVYPFGAFLKLNDYGYKEIWQDLWVAMAGMCSHLLLYLFALYFKPYLGNHLYHYFMTFNLQVFFFNLLPIYPMDGSKILLCLLSYWMDYLVCLKVILVVSFMTLFLLVYTFFDYSYLLIYVFLMWQLMRFSHSFYTQYCLLLLRRKENRRRKDMLHDDFKFYRNKQNLYLVDGKILNEKSFIKSRIFIDNTYL